jgi:hypothetical protein
MTAVIQYNYIERRLATHWPIPSLTIQSIPHWQVWHTMGARVAKERAANRSAKKRASASPAPTDLEGSTSTLATKKRVSALSEEQPI